MSVGPKRKAMDGTEDILSDLPRNVIDCILDSMPLRDAARTSILSSKWRYIWMENPQLVLDNLFYEETIKKKHYTKDKFESIVNKILLLHTHRFSILKFVLYIPNIYADESPDFDHSILVLSRSIKELTFDNENSHPYKLPSGIFSCPELTYLKLHNCIIKPPHTMKCFRNLISLHFKEISFSTNILGTLFSSAPLLEKLYLISCTGIDHFNIRARELQLLFISCISGFKSIVFRNTLNLTNVTIAPQYKVNNPQWVKTTNLIELVGSLPRVEALQLDGFLLKVLAAVTVTKRLPTVKHWMYLTLHNKNFNDLDQISCTLCLLKSVTNLWSLEIKAYAPKEETVVEPISNFLEEPDCMDLKQNTLRIVKISLHKYCWRAGLIFMKFLLAHCLLLEKMYVKHEVIDVSEGFRISKELMQYPRASPKAELMFEESIVSYFLLQSITGNANVKKTSVITSSKAIQETRNLGD
ncbi:F-box/FBD/LRR-repeat protein At1g13570-like [Cornus florida]|uniref:F-box/FBD/LRR-repeat protein At1g13570-like n=1 Tax=Cornus florida TaxID=4283 RepID=UPI0028A0A4E4|nr:F-box/FBD/LRR-repeat protein At1g13570-like [Cornus florida]